MLVFPESAVLGGDHTLAGASLPLQTLQQDRNIDIILALEPISAEAADIAAKSRNGLNKPVFAPIVLDATVQDIGRRSRKINQI